MAITDGVRSWQHVHWTGSQKSTSRKTRLLHKELDGLYRQAKTISINSASRFVFFSDCHRGDRGPRDVFLPNEQLFLGALEHYHRSGFTYVEVGDGDDLWTGCSLDKVKSSYPDVFSLFQEFHRQAKLYFILGNHEISGDPKDEYEKDGIPVYKCLRLREESDDLEIFILHGHQFDNFSSWIIPISRLVVRYLWPTLSRLEFACNVNRRAISIGNDIIAEKLLRWMRGGSQITICGHTHRMVYPLRSEHGYFNTGSCTQRGQLSGFEIEHGIITPIRWRQNVGMDGQSALQRVLDGDPIPLYAFRKTIALQPAAVQSLAA